jgi:hypothetical protein
LEGLGDDVMIKYPFNPSIVTIIKQKDDTVTFSISQTVMQITETSGGFLSVHYPKSIDSHVCSAASGDEASFGKVLNYTAMCEHGRASVSIYVRNDGTSEKECDTCSAPTPGEKDFVAYYLSIPCAPECVPKEPECYSGIMALEKDTDGDAMCEYQNQPFNIEEQLDSTVRFTFTNSWSCGMSDITLLYDTGDLGGPDCVSLNGLASGTRYSNVLTATCDPLTMTAEVEVYVSSASIAYKGITAQCEIPDTGACSFRYQLPCSTTMMCDYTEIVVDRRQLLPSAATGSKSFGQGFMTREMRSAAASSATSTASTSKDGGDDEDEPYCVHEDYPCEGDEESMVYVCHYSTRAGYQTFCIPETDSDIMRFYSNDYCGPCEGWNGMTHAGQAI